MKNIKSLIVLLMPFLVISVVFLVMYAAVQQSIRQSANDAPEQIAEDMAEILNTGGDPTAIASDVNGSRRIDVASSLSPWVGIYDATGTPIASDGELGGKPIPVPEGVFAHANALSLGKGGQAGENRVTLEPEPGVRIAAVVVPYDQSAYGKGSGYIVAGKSLRPYEDLIEHIGFIVIVGWAIAMAGWAVKTMLES